MKYASEPDSERLDKTKFDIASLGDEPDDKNYWLSQPAEYRIQHIEMLRMVNYGDKAASRLQRFFEIAELT